MKSLSRVQLLATAWTAAYQAASSMDFPGKSAGVGCHCLLHIYTTMYKIMNEKQLYSIGDPIQCCVVAYMERKTEKESIYVYIY